MLLELSQVKRNYVGKHLHASNCRHWELRTKAFGSSEATRALGTSLLCFIWGGGLRIEVEGAAFPYPQGHIRVTTKSKKWHTNDIRMYLQCKASNAKGTQLTN